MGVRIRLFLVINAFSRISGMVLAWSADLSLALAKQLLDSTTAESGCGRGSTGPTSRPAPGAASGTEPASPPESRGSSSPLTRELRQTAQTARLRARAGRPRQPDRRAPAATERERGPRGRGDRAGVPARPRRPGQRAECGHRAPGRAIICGRRDLISEPIAVAEVAPGVMGSDRQGASESAHER